MRTIRVTIDEELYCTLKRTAGPRGMSQFVAAAVREKLNSNENERCREYLAVEKDPDRRRLLDDWAAIETEGWR